MENLEKPKLPKLTRKQRAFVNELKRNPKISGTQAAMKAYNVKNEKVASVISSENLTKPSIISHLENYNELVEKTIANPILKYSNSDDIKELTLAVETSKWVHDKLHGKAVQKSVNLNASISLQDALDSLK